MLRGKTFCMMSECPSSDFDPPNFLLSKSYIGMRRIDEPLDPKPTLIERKRRGYIKENKREIETENKKETSIEFEIRTKKRGNMIHRHDTPESTVDYTGYDSYDPVKSVTEYAYSEWKAPISVERPRDVTIMSSRPSIVPVFPPSINSQYYRSNSDPSLAFSVRSDSIDLSYSEDTDNTYCGPRDNLKVFAPMAGLRSLTHEDLRKEPLEFRTSNVRFLHKHIRKIIPESIPDHACPLCGSLTGKIGAKQLVTYSQGLQLQSMRQLVSVDKRNVRGKAAEALDRVRRILNEAD